MVFGAGNGALHGGLSTVVGGLFVLAVFAVGGVLFVGLVPTIAGVTVGLIVLLMQSIPGAIVGAVGAWVHGRRAAGPATTTAR